MCVPCDDGLLNIRVGQLYLKCGSLNEDIKMYPEFFGTELKRSMDDVKYIFTDERRLKGKMK